MREVKGTHRACSVCNNLTEVDPCRICASPSRDHSVICVVEEPHSMVAVEKTRSFKGVYHVLHGSLSPIRHIGPNELQLATVRWLIFGPIDATAFFYGLGESHLLISARLDVLLRRNPRRIFRRESDRRPDRGARGAPLDRRAHRPRRPARRLRRNGLPRDRHRGLPRRRRVGRDTERVRRLRRRDHRRLGRPPARGRDLDRDGAVRRHSTSDAPRGPVRPGRRRRRHPSPTIIHDDTVPPCLAATTTTFTATPTLDPGDVATFSLVSVPNRSVALLVDVTTTYLPLGFFGWTQTNIFDALVLADDLGLSVPRSPRRRTPPDSGPCRSRRRTSPSSTDSRSWPKLWSPTSAR